MKKNSDAALGSSRLLFIKVTSLILITSITFFGLPESIIYSKTGLIRWTPFLLVFIVIPLLVYSITNDSHFKSRLLLFKSKIGYAALTPLIFGPLLGLWHGHPENKELELFGTEVPVIINHYWIGSNNDHLYRVEFTFNGTVFTTSTYSDKEENLAKGDTIIVIFSYRNPEISTVKR